MPGNRSCRAHDRDRSGTRHDDPDHFRKDFLRYFEVKPADIQRVAKRYLTDAKVTLLVRPLKPGDDYVAVIGENRKMVVYPLAELPEMGRGQGVQLQRYRDGGLSDATGFDFAQGLSWPMGGESGRTRIEADMGAWRTARGAAGRMPPTGFPRDNRFD